MQVDAVVVDWDTPQLARACLESLQDEHFASVRYVDARAKGWSYATAVNKTLARGTAPIVLALNADTEMRGSLAPILALFADERVAVVGPRQVNSNGELTHAGIFGSNEQPEHRHWLQPLAVHEQATADTRDAVSVSGSVYFARRSLWEQLGGFLQTEHFFEETWYSYLVRHHGYRVLYTGAVTWLHEFNQSPVDPEWRNSVAAASREIFRERCRAEGIGCD